VTPTFTALVKQGLQTIGHYRRALARTTLPGVAVLCYHGVRDDDMAPGTVPFQYLHIPAPTFESHCRVIRQCCDPISLDDWRAAIDGRATLPERPVLITFDDGYRSVLTMAAPILQQYHLPATVFVCTWPMGSRRMLWFDHIGARDGENAVEGWKSRDYGEWCGRCSDTPRVDEGDPRALMTPDELRTLANIEGIEIGGHTSRHPILSRASAAQQRDEIEQNIQLIQEWTGKPVRSFAYPNGRPGFDYNAVSTGILRGAGIDIAFTTHPDFARRDEPPLERSRFLLLDETSDAELAHRLAYSWPR
jgi:peptidoglycan/xylan/chitin deacetylase (PgdA/CDA1 family)